MIRPIWNSDVTKRSLAPQSAMGPIRLPLRCGAGRRAAAVLLAARGQIIRLAVDGCEDAAEFRMIDGQWVSEHGQAVQLDTPADAGAALQPYQSGCPVTSVLPYTTAPAL